MTDTGSGIRIVLYSDDLTSSLLEMAGFDSTRQAVSLPYHRHESHELVFLQQGTTAWHIDGGKKMVLKGGDVSVIQPGVGHRGVLDIIEPAVFFWLTYKLGTADNLPDIVSPSVSMEVLTRMGRCGNCVVHADKEMRTLFSALQKQMMRWSGGKERDNRVSRIRLISCEILLAFTDILEAKEPGVSEDEDSGPIGKLLRFIDDNLERKVGVDELASIAGMSQNAFTGKFRSVTGTTPSQYIMRRRISEARRLLAEEKISVIDAAFALGFPSSQYFASVFKRYTGTTPTQWKNNFSQKEREA